MIYKQSILTINGNNAKLDEDIYLFRLDKNIELYFTIVNNKYKFNKSDLNNIINLTNASYFQMRLYKNAEVKYTFAIQPTDNGKAILTITDDLIDEPIEVGDYDFQISLLDADKSSMISLPIVSKQIHVCEPLVTDASETGTAVLGLSTLESGEIVDAFDEEGNYIRKVHVNGELISAELFNKWEEALETNSSNIKTLDSQFKDIANELGRDSEGNPINMGTTATDIRSAIKELKDNQGNSGDGSSYTLPIATSTTLGGVKPITKTDKMTQEVGVDAEGKLYTTPIASGDSGETEDVLKGTLPYTVNENGLYLLSDKNATISTGSGAEDKVNFNDSSTIECQVKNYPNYCGNESYTIISNNSVSIERNVADKNCVLYFTLKNLKSNTTYTMVGKIISDTPKGYVRINSSYQINFSASDKYYFKSFVTNENQVSVEGMIVFTGGDVGIVKQYELHIFEGELTEMPSGTSFDITANTQYNLDGYLGSTLTCTTTDATVNVYKNESVDSEKGIIVFGDSIFALSSVASKLSKLIGKTVLDCSVGGARLTCTRDSSNDFYPYDMTQIADAIGSDDYSTQIAKGKNKNFTTLSTANINNYGTIILEFGTNDFANKASFSGTEKTTVEGALKYILTKIQTKYPKLRIVVLSTMQFVAIGSGSESGVPTHDDGTVWQMNEVMKNVCESDAYCVPFIDIYHKMQQNVTTRSTVTRDGVHLMSPTGEERYANLLNGQLKALGI